MTYTIFLVLLFLSNIEIKSFRFVDKVKSSQNYHIHEHITFDIGKDNYSNNAIKINHNTHLVDAIKFPSLHSEVEVLSEEEIDWRDREEGYTKTDPEEYPYAVFLVCIHRNNTVLSSCSGSLLTSKWVLTSAHCLREDAYFWIYAGGRSGMEIKAYLHLGTPLPSGSQILRSARGLAHPKYVPDGVYDVALIEVDGKFTMTPTVSTVTVSTEPLEWDSYVQCLTTSFGKVVGEDSNPDDYTRKTHLFEVKRPCVCSSVVYRLFLGSVRYHILCHRPAKDLGVCNGDSGGGLICYGELVALNMAVVAFNDIEHCRYDETHDIVCGLKGTLSVFQDICPAVTWIHKTANIFEKENIKKCREYEITADISFSSKCFSSKWNIPIVVIGFLNRYFIIFL